MFAGITVTLVDGLAEVGFVGEQAVQVAFGNRLALTGRDTSLPQFPQQKGGRADIAEPLENVADVGGRLFIHHQFAGHHVITQRRDPAHPDPFGAGSGELVADAFSGHLALKLGK